MKTIFLATVNWRVNALIRITVSWVAHSVEISRPGSKLSV